MTSNIGGFNSLSSIEHTPASGTASVPDPREAKLLKYDEDSGELLDGAEFKLQINCGDTWKDVNVAATSLVTGSGSGTSLRTSNGELVVSNLIAGSTYRFVEINEPTGYVDIGAGKNSDEFKVSSTEGKTVTMSNKKQEVNYKIKYYKENSAGSITYNGKNYEEDLDAAETKSGVPNSIPEVSSKNYTGYHLTSIAYKDSATAESETRLNVNADGSTIVNYYFDHNQYTVKYDKNLDTATGTTADSIHKVDVSKKLTKNGYGAVGYTFDGWSTNQDGTGSVYTDEQSIQNLSTVNDGVVTLHARWEINKHNISYAVTGKVPTGAPSAPSGATNVTYDTSQTVASPLTYTGYIFGGWTTSDATVSTTGDFTMPDNDVAFTGSWIANTDTGYKVEHYLVDGSGVATLKDTENLKGTTDTTVTATPKTYEGYTYDATYAGSVLSGTVAGDGSLTLKLYYTANPKLTPIVNVDKGHNKGVKTGDENNLELFGTLSLLSLGLLALLKLKNKKA